MGGKTLATIYDSVELQIPIPHLAEATEILYYCMDDLPVQTFPWLTLPIGMEAEVGPNWGTLTEIHRGITQEEIERILNDSNT